MKEFTENNLTYTFQQKVNGYVQWRCDYPDGEYSLAVVYKKRPTKRDIINAIDEVNEEVEY